MLGAAGKFKTAKEFAEYAQKDKMAFEIPIRDFVDRQIKEKYGLRRPEGEEEGGMLSPLKAYYQAKKELAFVKENIEPHYAEYQDENGKWKAEVYEAAWYQARKVKKDGEGFSGYLDFFNSLRKAHLLIESSDEAKRLYESFAEAKKLGWVRIRKEEEKNAPYPFEQMADGTFYFGEFPKFKLDPDATLAGVHNISPINLRKALSKGAALANPSAAVIDSEKYDHTEFGTISLVMPRRLVDKSSGRNAGTWTDDVWTPTYPQGRTVFTDEGYKNFEKFVASFDGEEKLKRDLFFKVNNSLDTGNEPNMMWFFLKEKGIDSTEYKHPGLDTEWDKYVRRYKTSRSFLNAYHSDSEMAKGVDRLVSRYVLQDIRKKYPPVERRDGESDADFRFRHFQELYLAHIEEYEVSKGVFREDVVKAAYEQQRKAFSTNGEVDVYATDWQCSKIVGEKGWRDEYEAWMEKKLDEFGVKHQLRDGVDRNGNAKWVPDDVWHASAIMNKQKKTGANSLGGWGVFIGNLAKNMSSLEEIRQNKSKLGGSEETKFIKDNLAKMATMIHAANEDYDLWRGDAAKALVKLVKGRKNLDATLKRLDIELDAEDKEALKEWLDCFDNFKADYFETKFERPVGLNEFASAVVPKGTDADLVEALRKQGLDIYEYDPKKEGSHKKAMDKATADKGKGRVKFKVGDKDSPIFVSNAAEAVKGIKQEKAPAGQWLAMLEKAGGLKAGEDKWLGLRAWLGEQAVDALAGKRDKNITKDEILDYIAKNDIRIEEVKYEETSDSFEDLKKEYDRILREEGYDAAWDYLYEKYGEEASHAFDDLGGELVINEADTAASILKTNKAINSTRLEYTTRGLENKEEIALTVPTIEPYNENDDVHFGDAGGGRAVAWVRFGDATSANADGTVAKVLVIDEIQSKRHQDGREKGYKMTEDAKRAYEHETELAKERGNEISAEYNDFLHKMLEKYNVNTEYDDVEIVFDRMSQEENEHYAKLEDELYKIWDEIHARERLKEGFVPDAPFDKNWHELAMKRMLRYAAENGYDKVAWTTGAQQAQRYNMGGAVESIFASHDNYDGEPHKYVSVRYKGGDFSFEVDKNGIIESSESDPTPYDGKPLAEVIGKEMAEKIVNLPQEQKDIEFSGDGLTIGDEGMKGFYDQMLPIFMNKYGKKWGVKVGEVELDLPNEGDRKMWSVDVNDAMKADVMRGQKKFKLKDSKGAFLIENGDGTYGISNEAPDVKEESKKLLERVEKISSLVPVEINTQEITVDEAENIYKTIGYAQNKEDGRKVLFANGTFGKIISHQGYDTKRLIPKLKECFESSVCLFGEREIKKDGHKPHTNFEGYHHYVNKIVDGGEEFYVRFTVQEVKTKTGKKYKEDFTPYQFHNSHVSDIEITKVGEAPITTPGYGPGNGGQRQLRDAKLQNVFELASRIKTLDSDGKGTTSSATDQTNGKKQASPTL